MEQQTKKILELLEQKRLMFEDYEAVTDKLSEAVNIDVMEDYITNRADLANKIDALDVRIKKLLAEDINGDIKRAFEQSTPQEGLPEELGKLYSCNKRILDIVRRIRLKNIDITADYDRTCSELSEKIKETSNMPKINKYLNNLSTQSETNNFGSV